jgi:hypothetical protein
MGYSSEIARILEVRKRDEDAFFKLMRRVFMHGLKNQADATDVLAKFKF